MRKGYFLFFTMTILLFIFRMNAFGQGPVYKEEIRKWNFGVSIGAGEMHRVLLPVLHGNWKMTEFSISPYIPRFGLALTQGFLPMHKPGSGKFMGNLQLTVSWTHSEDDYRFWLFPEAVFPVDSDKLSIMPGMRMHFLNRFYAGLSFGIGMKLLTDNGNLRLVLPSDRPQSALAGEAFFGINIFSTVKPGP